MKTIVLILFALILGLNTQAQVRGGSNIPQGNNQPTEEEIARYEREMEERREEYIDNFLTTLDADEFQKHIIKQHLNSFFDAQIAIFQTKYEHRLDRQAAIKNLEETHFVELEELISEENMSKIKDLIKGRFDEKEVVKKKKKKEKRKKKKNKN